MIRSFIIGLGVMVLCLASVQAFAQAQAPNDPFRGLVWGLSKDDVRGFETAALLEESETSLTYTEQDKNDAFAVIEYSFEQGRLWKIDWALSGYHTPTPDEALNRALDFENSLNRIFGAPSEKNVIWGDTLYKNHPKFWPRAYGMGDITLKTQWQKGETRAHFNAGYDGMFYQMSYTLEKIGEGPQVKPFTITPRP
jgi:hypothetical protein